MSEADLSKSTRSSLTATGISTTVGAIVWVVACPLLKVSLIQALLLLAPLVLVPLGWGLVRRSQASMAPEALTRWTLPRWTLPRWTLRLRLPAAVLLVGSFAFPQGSRVAVLLAVPWLLWTLAAALIGVLRLRSHGLRSLPELTRTVGLLYLAGAGVWTVITRCGLRPLDFDAQIVRLTAMHLHYVGFALPVLAATVYEARRSTATILACLGGILGFPLVATAMTLRQLGAPGWLELAAMSVFVTSCLALAYAQVRLALTIRQPGPLVLWLVSGSSLAGAMLLAMIYCHGVVSGGRWLDIPQMAISHGLLNALGFALAGLLAAIVSSKARG